MCSVKNIIPFVVRFLQAVNEKAVILTQLDRKTAELNCLQENANFMDIILKKGDRQYNLRLDDIKILRLEVLKLRCYGVSSFLMVEILIF